ncbi:MAG TPA: hypothetical protein VJT82_04215 [Pyrinomonadaceae bacterium]|nr:hypothetical protein [Pyrinomonadaceae bacterium]
MKVRLTRSVLGKQYARRSAAQIKANIRATAPAPRRFIHIFEEIGYDFMQER